MRGPSHENAEIVLNLWAYSDEQGYVQRLAGKCYSLLGNNAEKLSVLRALAKSDYLSAKWEPVPKNYSVINGDGCELQGVARTNEVMDEHAHVPLFHTLIERLEAELPVQLLCLEGEYKTMRMKIPQAPLVIRTLVIEQDDGRLVPVLNPLKL